MPRRRRSFRSRGRVRRNRRGRGSRSRRTARRAFTRSQSVIRRPRNVRLTVGRLPSFPDRLKTCLKYSTTAVSFNTNSNFYYAMRGNGIYDPDAQLGGNQPLYFDQLMGIYNNWIVSRSRLKIRITSNGTTSGACNGRGIVLPQKQVGAFTTVGAVLNEQPLAQIFNWNSVYRGTVEKNFQCATKVICRDFAMTESSFFGDAASDPLVQWFWAVYLESVDDSSNLSLFFECIVEYDCEFFNRAFMYSS